MCTAITLHGKAPIFGRTLDLPATLGEHITLAESGYPLLVGKNERTATHPAILGSAITVDGDPLWFDAMSEWGLAAAALNFPKSARYGISEPGKRPIPSYAVIPYILSRCKTISEAVELLATITVTNDAISADFPPSPLHWIISDGKSSVIAEPLSGGLSVRETACGILANEPPLSYHLARLAELSAIHPGYPENRFYPDVEKWHYSGGFGAVGLPGDFSSSARYLRAAYASFYSRADDVEDGEIIRFFRVAECVSVPHGCVLNEDGAPTRTVYTSCMELDKLVYYIKPYAALHTYAVELRDTKERELRQFPLPKKEPPIGLAAK